MLTGKRFRLRFETIAIETHGDERIAITIPSRDVIEVSQDPLPANTRMVGMRWKGRSLVMFGDDVAGHGDKIKDSKSNGRTGFVSLKRQAPRRSYGLTRRISSNQTAK
jgi:hypothetical protein